VSPQFHFIENERRIKGTGEYGVVFVFGNPLPLSKRFVYKVEFFFKRGFKSKFFKQPAFGGCVIGFVFTGWTATRVAPYTGPMIFAKCALLNKHFAFAIGI